MNTQKFACASILATCLVSTAFGAGYMKFDGVDGESTRAQSRQIEVLSVAGLSETATRDAASGLPTGKRQHKPITLTKSIDKASPVLAKGMTISTPVSLSSDGVLYQLEGVKVVSVTRKGDVETVTLTCTSIKAGPPARAVPATPATQAAPAQDHNSSRSNKTSS